MKKQNLVRSAEAEKQMPKLRYDCSACPAYCCSYDRINVTKRDINRLAKHFEITPEEATERFTKIREGERVLRHQKDEVYGTVCMNLDLKTRRCTVYDARPAVCREYPEINRCGYYDFLSWERKHQDNPKFVPLKKG